MSRADAGRRGAVRDRGLQPERTTLAWSRTALSLVGLGVLVARSLVGQFGTSVAVIGLVGVSLAAAAMLRAHRRYRHWTVAAGQVYRPAAGNAALAAVVAVLGVAVLTTFIGTTP